MNKASHKSYRSALNVTIIIFFFWGFGASSNALLIPVLKETFHLSQTRAQMVEMSFYFAYFLGSMINFILCIINNKWATILNAKRGMVIGLLLSAFGSFLLLLAIHMHIYFFFLVCLFIVALGFSLQQIVANPLLVQLGGTPRLILAGSINSLGNTIAPLILSFFLFGDVGRSYTVTLSSLQLPYIILASLYIVFAIWFYKVRLPEVAASNVEIQRFGALKYPQLILGMIAIFCYVGGEVTMQSNLPALIKSGRIMGLSTKDAVHYFSLFGGSLMIGRCTGAVFNFRLARRLQNIFLIIIPFLTFALVLFVNWLKGSPLNDIIDFSFFLPILIVALLLSREKPSKILLVSSIASTLLLGLAISLNGKYAMYCVISTAFFSSLMWPCIFPLAIKGLGIYTQQASSLLIMMILGGAILPVLQGKLSDTEVGIQLSYILPLLCFVYTGWYAWKAKRLALRLPL